MCIYVYYGLVVWIPILNAHIVPVLAVPWLLFHALVSPPFFFAFLSLFLSSGEQKKPRAWESVAVVFDLLVLEQ